ncbi:MAG: membrane protein insertion efficiency factor YidD [Actinobacteria bacterium]|nr:MAG: membrane protein insertion efficiency factor YidD [Actinomycetota bacterium]
MRYVLIVLVKIYQIIISPLLPRSCRYYPSCSSYAADALKKHGAIKGSLKAAWRILRCHPWAKGGYDPA